MSVWMGNKQTARRTTYFSWMPYTNYLHVCKNLLESMPYTCIYPFLINGRAPNAFTAESYLFLIVRFAETFLSNYLQISPLSTSTLIFFTILKESQDNSLSPTDPHMIFW